MKTNRAALSLIATLIFTAVSTPFAKPPSTINVPSSTNGWQTFTDMGGFYTINHPTGWQVLQKGNAVVITSPGGPEDRGVFGITPRPEGVSIQDAVDKEFGDPDRAGDLMKAPARLGGQPAIKVWGSKKGDPNIRIVEYYVQRGSQQFYILFQSPHATTTHFSPIFNAMIASMRFLK